ncbi:MAG: TrkH family potassium uptake protein [Rhodobacteraceae bacterium]|nr:TrkH family potassium uptake protein [Paracoccaceae bacterium]
MATRKKSGLAVRMPLFLLICGLASLSMVVPVLHALSLGDEAVARSFFYSAVIGIVAVVLVALAKGNRPSHRRPLVQLFALLATFALLPIYLALPFYDVLRTTTYLNAYLEMVSALTTTGFETFAPDRLAPTLHLWRAQVAWMGGFLMWVAASSILAPMGLGGFEVTARGEPGRVVAGAEMRDGADPRVRLLRVARTLTPVYAGLTGTVCILLLLAGEEPLVAVIHAMSVMATSGISPIGGVEHARTGFGGEAILFLFMFFALSRLTFLSDTVTVGERRLDRDPEFRIGIFLVLGVPAVILLRHWLGAYEVTMQSDFLAATRALWGSLFTVMSFLTTTGFVSADWGNAQMWSGLETSEIILMGLALIGGGVATTAGGVKLLRVFALYLNGLREMERLVHPSSVSGARLNGRRIQTNGAFIAWVFFMLFALFLAVVTVLLAAQAVSFEQALLLSVASLSTTGPLVGVATETSLWLSEFEMGVKITLCVAMVLGRLETLAIVALLTPNLWRS